MNNILLLFDSFKGSLTALEASRTVEEIIHSNFPNTLNVNYIIVSDGGNGFLNAIKTDLMQGITCSTFDPLMRKIETCYLLKEKTAFIETAKASGIQLLSHNELSPLHTSSYGTGILIKDAISKGAKKIVLGLGGSATNDGGLGIINALGINVYDKEGNEITITKNLDNAVQLKVPLNLPEIHFELACDVTNPLTGPSGASNIYGPQKGASVDTIKLLEHKMSTFGRLLESYSKKELVKIKGAGAAGGIPTGLMAFFNTSIRSGFDLCTQIHNLNLKVKNIDLLITGEGKFDPSSLQGKTVGKVISLSKKHGKICLVIAGQQTVNINDRTTHVISLVNNSCSLEQAIKEPKAALQKTLIPFLNNYPL